MGWDRGLGTEVRTGGGTQIPSPLQTTMRGRPAGKAERARVPLSPYRQHQHSPPASHGALALYTTLAGASGLTLQPCGHRGRASL